MSSILGAAKADRLISDNPCAHRNVNAPAVPKRLVVPWTRDQVLAVAEALPERYRAVAIVGPGAGLRQGEVFGLRVSDIGFLRRTIHVRQQIVLLGGRPPEPALPKRNKQRAVPLADTGTAAVNAHLALRPAKGEELLFTSCEGNPLNRNTSNRTTWKPALRAVGIEPTRENGMHALRHHYASMLLDAGVSIRVLADYLGHDDPGFTLRVYSHLMPGSDDRARQAVDAAYAPEGAAEASG